jgi:hypothetical protein
MTNSSQVDKHVILFCIFLAQITLAEVTDIKIDCLNSKGEKINSLNGFMRIDRESVKIYENGGFAVIGQYLIIQRKREGGLVASYEPCSATLEDPIKSVLLTCSTGSHIEFLNVVLPNDRSKCR